MVVQSTYEMISGWRDGIDVQAETPQRRCQIRKRIDAVSGERTAEEHTQLCERLMSKDESHNIRIEANELAGATDVPF
ncbi:MAG: hypothetical protein O3B95_12010 [Chloroflexi bacterium]|nr:hypothetical protein [Chloroflexota bacterium]